MKIQHVYRTETYGHNIGQKIPVTLCQYEDADGQPMSARLHGHLHIQIVQNMLKACRSADGRLAR